MSVAAVLAIIVVAGDAGSATTTALLESATQAVGVPGSVVVREAATPTDADALRVEKSEGVRAVAQVDWRDAARLHAHLRLHAARTDRWIDRDVTFAEIDRPPERGRALGFALASMLPEGDPTLQLAATRTDQAPPRAPDLAPGRRALGLSALAAAGLGGPASGFGSAAHAELFLAPDASVGVSVAARLGTIAAVDGDELTMSIGAGGAWWVVAPKADQRLGLGLRSELLVLYHAVSHDKVSGGTLWKGHALPGAHLGAEATWRLVGGLEVLLGLGAELAFGTIDVTVVPPTPGGGAATIPPLRAVGEVGIRARF